ncbi:hypothetical protein ACRALDRAFT_206242 [Sodiomyces alcalophilus JCM 7366]|uniref:uncharacterized protein n=1 Tax=Sodiomyces alcalophilus JCM 7366 TaxID=591952 RepID=UPI0039B3BFD7
MFDCIDALGNHEPAKLLYHAGKAGNNLSVGMNPGKSQATVKSSPDPGASPICAFGNFVLVNKSKDAHGERKRNESREAHAIPACSRFPVMELGDGFRFLIPDLGMLSQRVPTWNVTLPHKRTWEPYNIVPVRLDRFDLHCAFIVRSGHVTVHALLSVRIRCVVLAWMVREEEGVVYEGKKLRQDNTTTSTILDQESYCRHVRISYHSPTLHRLFLCLSLIIPHLSTLVFRFSLGPIPSRRLQPRVVVGSKDPFAPVRYRFTMEQNMYHFSVGSSVSQEGSILADPDNAASITTIPPFNGQLTSSSAVRVGDWNEWKFQSTSGFDWRPSRFAKYVVHYIPGPFSTPSYLGWRLGQAHATNQHEISPRRQMARNPTKNALTNLRALNQIRPGRVANLPYVWAFGLMRPLATPFRLYMAHLEPRLVAFPVNNHGIALITETRSAVVHRLGSPSIRQAISSPDLPPFLTYSAFPGTAGSVSTIWLARAQASKLHEAHVSLRHVPNTCQHAEAVEMSTQYFADCHFVGCLLRILYIPKCTTYHVPSKTRGRVYGHHVPVIPHKHDSLTWRLRSPKRVEGTYNVGMDFSIPQGQTNRFYPYFFFSRGIDLRARPTNWFPDRAINPTVMSEVQPQEWIFHAQAVSELRYDERELPFGYSSLPRPSAVHSSHSRSERVAHSGLGNAFRRNYGCTIGILPGYANPSGRLGSPVLISFPRLTQLQGTYRYMGKMKGLGEATMGPVSRVEPMYLPTHTYNLSPSKGKQVSSRMILRDLPTRDVRMYVSSSFYYLQRDMRPYTISYSTLTLTVLGQVVTLPLLAKDNTCLKTQSVLQRRVTSS